MDPYGPYIFPGNVVDSIFFSTYLWLVWSGVMKQNMEFTIVFGAM